MERKVQIITVQSVPIYSFFSVQPGFGQTVAQITETMSLKSSHAMQSYGEVTADGKGSIPPIVLRILCAMSNADTGYSRPGVKLNNGVIHPLIGYGTYKVVILMVFLQDLLDDERMH